MWITRDKNGTLTLWSHEYPQRTRGEKWIAFIDGEREFEYWGMVK